MFKTLVFDDEWYETNVVDADQVPDSFAVATLVGGRQLDIVFADSRKDVTNSCAVADLVVTEVPTERCQGRAVAGSRIGEDDHITRPDLGRRLAEVSLDGRLLMVKESGSPKGLLMPRSLSATR